MKFSKAEIDAVIATINATGYGLTFGLHSRIDDRVQRIVEGWLAGGLVTEAIVWNNNASEPLGPIAGAKIINAGE